MKPSPSPRENLIQPNDGDADSSVAAITPRSQSDNSWQGRHDTTSTYNTETDNLKSPPELLSSNPDTDNLFEIPFQILVVKPSICFAATDCTASITGRNLRQRIKSKVTYWANFVYEETSKSDEGYATKALFANHGDVDKNSYSTGNTM